MNHKSLWTKGVPTSFLDAHALELLCEFPPNSWQVADWKSRYEALALFGQNPVDVVGLGSLRGKASQEDVGSNTYTSYTLGALQNLLTDLSCLVQGLTSSCQVEECFVTADSLDNLRQGVSGLGVQRTKVSQVSYRRVLQENFVDLV